MERRRPQFIFPILQRAFLPCALLIGFLGISKGMDGQVVLPAYGQVSTIVGNGNPGYFGDGGQAAAALVNSPNAIAIDPFGNIYFVDQGNQRIRMVVPQTGIITTVAGNGTAGYSGDGGPATSASLNTPTSVAADGSGNVYIADQGNQRIRKVSTTTGIITTVAGTGTAGFSGDGGLATNAALNTPTGVAVDEYGNLFIADQGNQRVREIVATTGVITTVAGNGTAGYSGDGGTATAAMLNNISGIAADLDSHLFIADSGNQRVREVDLLAGTITTIAGNGTAGYSGDGGPATTAEINGATGVGFDPTGNIYIADHGNSRIRKVDGVTGIISTFAGDGVLGAITENAQATSTSINFQGLVSDQEMNLYAADPANNRIWTIGSDHTITIGMNNSPTPALQSLTSSSANSACYNYGVGNGGNSPTAPANGGSWYIRFHYTSGYYGCNLGFTPNASWITLEGKSILQLGIQCTPQFGSNQPIGTTYNCVIPINIAANTGTTRTSSLDIFWETYYAGTVSNNVYSAYPITQDGVPESLTVQSTNGGMVTSSPSGIYCPGQYCTVSFSDGTSVRLTATPSTGYQFTGWSGACSGTSTTCIVPMTSPETVSATFAPIPETLTVDITAGNGTVMSSPAGIACPGACATSFSYGSTVYLTATPAAGYVFTGWGGACVGTGVCTVTMGGPETVYASFSLPTFSVIATNPSQSTPLSLGHTMAYSIIVNPLYGFTGNVALSVEGLPAGVTASISPVFVSTPGRATLTLTAAYSNTTYIGTILFNVVGTGGSISNATNIYLTTRPLQYKGYCGVQ